jgi:hypothetical protein
MAFKRIDPSIVTPAHLMIFKELRELIMPYAAKMEIRRDEPYTFEVWTEHEYRTKSFRPKIKKGILFARVLILRHHVGLYFYPLHLRPSMLDTLPEALQEIAFGKTAFHVKALPESLQANIKEMLVTGFRLYESRGWILQK